MIKYEVYLLFLSGTMMCDHSLDPGEHDTPSSMCTPSYMTYYVIYHISLYNIPVNVYMDDIMIYSYPLRVGEYFSYRICPHIPLSSVLVTHTGGMMSPHMVLPCKY